MRGHQCGRHLLPGTEGTDRPSLDRAVRAFEVVDWVVDAERYRPRVECLDRSSKVEAGSVDVKHHCCFRSPPHGSG